MVGRRGLAARGESPRDATVARAVRQWRTAPGDVVAAAHHGARASPVCGDEAGRGRCVEGRTARLDRFFDRPHCERQNASYSSDAEKGRPDRAPHNPSKIVARAEMLTNFGFAMHR